MKKQKFVKTVSLLLTCLLCLIPLQVSASTSDMELSSIFLYPFQPPVGVAIMLTYLEDSNQDNDGGYGTNPITLLDTIYGTYEVGRNEPDNPEEMMNDMYTYLALYAYGNGAYTVHPGYDFEGHSIVFTFAMRVELVEPVSYARVLSSDGGLALSSGERIEAMHSVYDLTFPVSGYIYVNSSTYTHYDSDNQIIDSDNSFYEPGYVEYLYHYGQWLPVSYD